MRVSLKFARRYLFSRKSINTINIISIISMVGMTIGVAAFILILSVFNGFESLVVGLYDSFYADIRIEASKGKIFKADSLFVNQVARIDGVQGVSKVLEEHALLRNGDQQSIATVRGVDDAYGSITGIDTCMAFDDSFILHDQWRSYAILGAGIDQALQSSFKDALKPITVYMPRRGKSMHFLPTDEFRRKQIVVWGAFTIQDDFDAQYVFVPLEFMRQLLQYTHQVSSLEIAVKPGYDRNKLRSRIAAALGKEFKVQTKFEQNATLFKIMKIEKLVVYLILSLVLFIVAFNMIGSLSMLVIDKKKDIGILKTMGATPGLIRNIFLSEGLLQGLISIGLGFVIAIVFSLLQEHFGLIKIQGGGNFLVSYYPVKLKLLDFAGVAVLVFSIVFMASWFPAVRASAQSQILER